MGLLRGTGGIVAFRLESGVIQPGCQGVRCRVMVLASVSMCILRERGRVSGRSHAILGELGLFLETARDFPLAAYPHLGPLKVLLTGLQDDTEHSYCDVS